MTAIANFLQICCPCCLENGDNTSAILYEVQSGEMILDVYLCPEHAAKCLDARVKKANWEIVKEKYPTLQEGIDFARSVLPPEDPKDDD